MQEHELRMIQRRQLLEIAEHQYDQQPVAGVTTEDLDAAYVDSYLAAVRAGDRRLSTRGDDEILRRTGVMTSNGSPTLAGLYALGDYLQGSYPSLTVTAAVQLPSNTGARNRDLQHFTGPLPALLEDTLDWCARNLAVVRAYRPDGHLAELPELPLSAARELLANALVHRDLGPDTLGIGKSIQVRLTPSALMVLSPGGLKGISLQQLESEDHAQAAVNQRLYAIARRLRTADGLAVIEGEGGGIREVFRAAESYGLRTPTLIDTGVEFKAMLWRPEPDRKLPDAALTVETPPHVRPSRNDPRVSAALELLGEASIQELQASTGLTARQIRYSLARLMDSGFVEMNGRQGVRGTTYRLRREPPRRA